MSLAASLYLLMNKRLFLRTGDKVRHINYCSWGTGEVVEEKHSELPGGFCLVRIFFQDGNERSFINDLNNHSCCCYTGIRLIDEQNIWLS
jgi:hypothetical protein